MTDISRRSRLDKFFLMDEMKPEKTENIIQGTSVSDEVYMKWLQSLEDNEWVLEVKDSRFLDEVILYCDPAVDNVFTSLVQSGVFIDYVAYEEDHEEYGDVMVMGLRTTGLFVSESNIEEYFPGEYTDEVMAFLKLQLEMFAEVKMATLQRHSDGVLRVHTTLTAGCSSSEVFDEILSFLGCTIESVSFSEGVLSEVVFGFDYTKTFDREAVDVFRLSKLREYGNYSFDTSSAVEGPCGHLVEPTIEIISDMRDIQLSAFEKQTIRGIPVAVIPVADSTDSTFTVTDWPDGTSPTEGSKEGFTAVCITRGYVCSECDVLYASLDDKVLRNTFTDQLQASARTVEIPDEDTSYMFLVFNGAFRPSEYM